MNDCDILIAGAGPVGLTAAIELARRGIACRIVDPLLEAPQYAKAVGVQPRTLEIFEGMGVLRQVLDASVPLRGQMVCINGKMAAQPLPPLPADVPFGFIAIPQYETERVLAEALAMHGLHIERGLRLTAFEQDADGVTATLSSDAGDSRVRCRYLIGADGAHSTVRKGLGLSFEGGAFDEQYMLGDVEVDWSLPRDQVLRAMHQTEGRTDDVLVCVPLPGRGRYRMSMPVADDLATQRVLRPTASRMASKAAASPSCTTSRRCSTGCRPSRWWRETCAGRRCFASATASSMPTAVAACSWPVMRRTSTRPPARRA